MSWTHTVFRQPPVPGYTEKEWRKEIYEGQEGSSVEVAVFLSISQRVEGDFSLKATLSVMNNRILFYDNYSGTLEGAQQALVSGAKEELRKLRKDLSSLLVRDW